MVGASGWGPRHALAAATGAILTYGWISIARMLNGATALGVPTTAFDVVGQVVVVGAVLGLVGIAARRLDEPAARAREAR
jgi:hypothetical protein